MNFRSLIIILVAAAVLAPQFSFAATSTSSFRYGGWLPFWKQADGALDVAKRLHKLYSVSPFSFEVRSGGKFVDKLEIKNGFWPAWISAAKDMKVKIIPTIAWFDGPAIHKLLSKKSTRIAHENAIAKLVKDNKFDGIDIDYESKLDKTNPYFALLIEGLAIRLRPMKKLLTCTIEARMPLTSRYDVIPDDIKYANDYPTLNKFCDEVRIMAYDQGLVDIRLNRSKGNGSLYAPVADPDWTEKIIQEALKTINKNKIVLGIPTYGYEYEVAWDNGVLTYKRLRSHTYEQAIERANLVGTVPSRNSAGELSFAYVTSTAVFGVSKTLTWTVSSSMPKEIAAKPMGSSLRYVSMSDAESTAHKIDLAKKYGLRGAVFFKFDGSQDPKFWEVIK